MNKTNNHFAINRKNLRVSIISVLVLYAITHLYRSNNLLFSHDSMGVFANEIGNQTMYGRYMQRFIYFIRGGVVSPQLIGALSMLFLCISVYLISDIFNFQKSTSIIWVAGLLVCNLSLTLSNATFLPWMDSYMGALLAAIAGVWFYQKGGAKYYIYTVLCFVVCLGLYMAYICVALGLFLIIFYCKLLKDFDWKKWWTEVAKVIGLLFASAILYYASWQMVLYTSHLSEPFSNNSMITGAFESIMDSLTFSYKYFFDWLLDPYVHFSFYGIQVVGIIKYVNILTCLFLILLPFYYNFIKRKNIFALLMNLLCVMLGPFVLNFVGFMAPYEHELMIYAFCLIYVYLVIISEYMDVKKIRVLIYSAVFIIIWNNVVYANQVYLNKALQEQATLSYMTRIVNDIEDTEGYIVGETPVRFVGSFYHFDYIQPFPDDEMIRGAGMDKTAVTYDQTVRYYIRYILGIQMQTEEAGDGDIMICSDMPCWPAKESVEMKNGIVYVKLSN